MANITPCEQIPLDVLLLLYAPPGLFERGLLGAAFATYSAREMFCPFRQPQVRALKHRIEFPLDKCRSKESCRGVCRGRLSRAGLVNRHPTQRECRPRPQRRSQRFPVRLRVCTSTLTPRGKCDVEILKLPLIVMFPSLFNISHLPHFFQNQKTDTLFSATEHAC